ncbi:hypothetical protein [Mucilaginibacter terrae]|uniref:Uncharacterized protein n=1 Tax=Mucilaginibacter terrae TaxID=1955052 RepID=A0ABU3GNN5_9SPHI|nr:hypothetical protein [Mucilaginibacter terrae]MDT3401386.1 hypothetical protein [Mucilaginibacter terrae]
MKTDLPIRLLMPAGLFIISASFIVGHYTALPDFANGLLLGVGIGLIFLSVMGNFRGKQV